MINIPKKQLEQLLDFPSLIKALQQAFREDYTVPVRHHHNFPNPSANQDSTLLLMPAWQVGQYLGVKIVTVAPENGQYQLPAIHGIYILFDAEKGIPLAQIDAQSLTVLRTAATSALASSFLSRKNSRSLLMIGTGALAPQLIKAHSSTRPIEEVFIWGRNFKKASRLAEELQQGSDFFSKKNISIFPVKKIEERIKNADIISCATLSKTPLVFGENLVAGQHLDLVGAYLPDMREADDVAVQRSSVFIDTYDGAKESGDIAIPLQSGILNKEKICGDLFQLCRNEKSGRTNNNEITFFKSVGHALEDLAAAKFAFEKIK